MWGTAVSRSGANHLWPPPAARRRWLKGALQTEWAGQDSNLRATDYESAALTT